VRRSAQERAAFHPQNRPAGLEGQLPLRLHYAPIDISRFFGRDYPTNATLRVGSLHAGSHVDRCVSVAEAADLSQQFGAEVDTSDEIRELNESNNVLRESFRISAPAPDLA
jgi:hypothetical protein